MMKGIGVENHLRQLGGNSTCELRAGQKANKVFPNEASFCLLWRREQCASEPEVSKTPRCLLLFAFASMRSKKSRSPAGETKGGLGEKGGMKSMNKFS